MTPARIHLFTARAERGYQPRFPASVVISVPLTHYLARIGFRASAQMGSSSAPRKEDK